MSTYYNYVRRGPESQVDWGKIGSEISGEIDRVSKERQSKREELDKLSVDLVKGASQVSLPEQNYLRNMVLNGTNDMKKLALAQNRLLKEGKITPSQYKMVMENMKNNVQSLDSAVKSFAPVYKRDLDRLAKDEMGYEEEVAKQKLFEYGNLENKTLIINADGNFVFTDLDQNGDPIADPSKMMGIGVLNQGIQAVKPKFDVKKTLDDAFTSIGEVTKILRSGGIESETSVLNNENYTKVRDSVIDSIVEDRAKLVETMGNYYGGYTPVFDKSKAGGKNIYFDSNNNALPTDEQKKEIREKLKSEFDARVKIDRKGTAVFNNRTTTPKEEDLGFTLLNQTYIPGAGGFQVAEDAILAVGSGIGKVDDLNLIIRRVDPNISIEAIDNNWPTENQLTISAPGVSPVTITENDDIALINAIDQVRQELYNAGLGATPSGGATGGSGLPPSR
jgi:hypothetical protein